jgi:hypothetical protein
MITQPIGYFNPDSGLWRLHEEWTCDITNRYRIRIKEGYESDGASIPFFLWSFVGPRYSPGTMPAALAHDALCDAEFCEIQRNEADNIFWRLLPKCGTTPFKARLYWFGVRLGAGYVQVRGWFWKRDLSEVLAARRFITLEEREAIPC